jgi:hypothetical protein
VITVATVVEGHGEVRALPTLVRRVAAAHGGPAAVFEVRVPPPFRLARSAFLQPAELARAVELQARRVDGAGGVVVLLDADDDCAVDLTKRIRATYGGSRAFALVAAVREYESVFLPQLGFDGPDAEAVRDAKGEVGRLAGAYKETVHQERHSATLDLDHARRCRWFRKFEKELLAILRG